MNEYDGLISKLGLNPQEIHIAKGFIIPYIFHREKPPNYLFFIKRVLISSSPIILILLVLIFLYGIYANLIAIIFVAFLFALLSSIEYINSRWVLNRNNREWIIVTDLLGQGVEHELVHISLHSDILKQGKKIDVHEWIKKDLEVEDYLEIKLNRKRNKWRRCGLRFYALLYGGKH